MSARVDEADVVQDLEQRIDALEHIDEAAFGAFTRLDWLILLIAAVVLPTIALVWAA